VATSVRVAHKHACSPFPLGVCADSACGSDGNFGGCDRDKDGELSKDELSGALQRWHQDAWKDLQDKALERRVQSDKRKQEAAQRQSELAKVDPRALELMSLAQKHCKNGGQLTKNTLRFESNSTLNCYFVLELVLSQSSWRLLIGCLHTALSLRPCPSSARSWSGC
jgi:hypothetical protein